MRSLILNENKPVINKQKQSNRLNAKKYLEYFLHCTQHSHVIILAYNKQNVKWGNSFALMSFFFIPRHFENLFKYVMHFFFIDTKMYLDVLQ